MLRNTNKLSGATAEERLLFSLNLIRPRICIFYPFFFIKTKIFLLSFPNPSASKGQFHEPPQNQTSDLAVNSTLV